MKSINLWPNTVEEEFKNLKLDNFKKLVNVDAFEFDFVFSHIPGGTLGVVPNNFNFEHIYEDCSKESTFYIHIPFCERACKYCYFCRKTIGNKPSQKAREEIDFYLDNLIKEFEILAKLIKNWNIFDSVYIGGGTPSILSEAQLLKLWDGVVYRVKERIQKRIELSVEMHPETITEQKIRLLKKLGTTRVSFGIQTFNNVVLNKVGRLPASYEGIKRKTEIIKGYGFDTWNVDMIYGLPGQSFEILEQDLERIKEISPPSVTWYQLWYKPRRREREIRLKEIPKEEFFTADEFIKARFHIRNEMLSERYSNYHSDWYVKSKKDYAIYEVYKIESKGNVGIGLGIYEYYNKYTFENVLDFNEYYDKTKKGILPIKFIREMSESDLFVKNVSIGLKGLLPFDEIEARNKAPKDMWLKIQELIKGGVFIKNSNQVKLNGKYQILRDYIAMEVLRRANAWYVEKKK